MTTTTKLQHLFDHAAKRIAVFFKENGEVAPMWHAVDRDGENMLIVTPWQNQDEKESTVDALRALFRSRGVTRYVFMGEAWTVLAPNLDDVGSYIGRFKEHPDRREALAIHAEDEDGSQLSGWYYILRPEHAPATLSPLHMNEATHITGTLHGLLKEQT